jgi:prepilin-type N-terminal cleavage/methylation domain-containing protein/prepilin-type processing-associated H-X9-DG protein
MRFDPALRRSMKRNGFTLVELLVVIAIIGVLVALLLPAVQAAREAARRVQCSNHLKQLALGCLLHEDTHKHLPTGGWNWYWSGDPDRGFDRRQPGGWSFTVLPFIEQKALHELGLGQTVAAKKPEFKRRGSSPVNVFYCPTRRPPRALSNIYQYCNGDAVTTAARTDYAANSGTDQSAWWGTVPSVDNPAFADATGFNYPDYNQVGTGVIFSLSTVKLRDVTDGTSHTYVLGEKYLNADNYTNSAEGTDNNPTYGGFDWDWQRWQGNGLVRDRKGLSDWISFGGPHPAGANMAFCDGSVRHVKFSIDLTTHTNLCHKSDGNTLDGSKY